MNWCTLRHRMLKKFKIQNPSSIKIVFGNIVRTQGEDSDQQEALSHIYILPIYIYIYIYIYI
jgi:hypothetical protein